MKHASMLFIAFAFALYLGNALTASAQTATTTGTTTDATTATTTSTTTTATTTGEGSTAAGTVRVAIIHHLCPANIQSVSSLQDLGTGANRLNVCPTVTVPGNSPVAGTRAGYQYAFNYSLTGQSTGSSLTVFNQPRFFVQRQICEPDLRADINGDNRQSSSVCLDISRYVFTDVPRGSTTLTLTQPIFNTRLGAVESATTNGGASGPLTAIPGNAFMVNNSGLSSGDTATFHTYSFINVGSGQVAPPPPPNLTESQRTQLAILLSVLVQLLQQLAQARAM